MRWNSGKSPWRRDGEAAIAALDLLDLFGIDFGINRLNGLLVPRAAVPEPETSFRSINGVPVALELAGASLALGCFERHRFAATALSGIAGAMAIFALVNHLSGVHTLSVETPTPLTAIALLWVAGAIILRIGTMPALRQPRPLWHLLIVLGCAVIAPLCCSACTQEFALLTRSCARLGMN